MKYIWTLLLAFGLYAQDGAVTTVKDSVTLDDVTTSASRFLKLADHGIVRSESTFGTLNRRAQLTDHMLISGEIDSLKASTALDSISGYIDPLDQSGNLLSGGRVHFDFTNHDSIGVQGYIAAFTPFNRTTPTRGTTAATFWVDLSGLLRPAAGYKVTWLFAGESANDSLKVRYNVAVGVK